MEKKENMKSLRVITFVVAAAVLVGVFTLKEDTSYDDFGGNISADDISQSEKQTADELDSSTDSQLNSDKDTSRKRDTDSSSESDKSSDKDSDSDTDSSSDTDTDTDSSSSSDTDSSSDSDSDDEIAEAEEGTVFPYRGVWTLIVVNKYNPIPDNYYFTLADVENGKQVDSRIVEDLEQMFYDMRAVGINPTINEAYRTQEDQEQILQNYIDEYIAQGYTEEKARAEADKWVAKPGTSEHQVGLALDINGDSQYTSNEMVYNWLAQNAYRYGFVLRYPQGKESITGIDYEPWHYRYVGVAAAEEMYNSGMCLEEYLSE